ncbi:YihY/virulence factor BrkB family protein [Prescottella equi]|uniref:YihY/virulence factor BrkB family protein n=1 Tax=Rhodococcus hoagii TaxID=43767 RepID=UPI001EECE990|nr:YihY/virulence factor BrkB family protein [Prescottella equi]
MTARDDRQAARPTGRAAEEVVEPESPDDLTKRSWMYVLRKTAREFGTDQCTDLAAALTYYAVLALFPALLVIVSLLGVFGQGQRTVDAVMEMVGQLGPTNAVDTLREPVEQLVAAPSAGIALVIGVLGALWSASGYVGAFARAMNRIYEIEEGRPIWKLRPLLFVVTAFCLVAVGASGLMLVISGPVARSVGDVLGLGDAAVTAWDIAKWPVLLLVVGVLVAVLYYVTPNVSQPKFRWISPGAAIAIVVWIGASALFAVYVSNFASYNKTYGSLAGAVVFLLWLWITNLALLFGAEFDAELERGRELQAGLPAEKSIQLPPRDTRDIEKREKQRSKDVEDGRRLRLSHSAASPTQGKESDDA